MVEPRNSLSLDSPSEPLSTPHSTYKDLLSTSSKTELIKPVRRGESVSSLSSTGTIKTPTLDNDPTVEVLSMGFANSEEMESSASEELMLHPDSFGLNDLGTSSLVAAPPTDSMNSTESPLMVSGRGYFGIVIMHMGRNITEEMNLIL